MLRGMTNTAPDQVAAVLRLLRGVFGEGLVGVYQHGSAVLGEMRPTSDVDLLAVCRRSSTVAERRSLVEGLLDVSGRRARRVPGRPVELTIVVQSDVRPWRYPPAVEFQYGEWLRDDYEGGVTPGPEVDPDVALIVTVALRGGEPLAGPPLADVLDPVPPRDVRRATVAGVPALLDDLDTDTRNALLTLARIWTTLATGDIWSKDGAAGWVLDRLPAEHRPVMAMARDDYLGAPAAHPWSDALPAARACARRVVMEIDRLKIPE